MVCTPLPASSALPFGPLAGGWLYDNLGRASPFYANSMMLLAAAVLVMALLREPVRRGLARA